MKFLSSKLTSKKRYLLILCAVVLILSLVTVSFAWLLQLRQRSHTITTSNFTLITDVYFLQNDGITREPGSLHKDPLTGYYIVDLSNPSALNYGNKLKVDIKYKGVTASYLRVYVGDMWLVNNKSIFKQDTVFLTPTGNWLDNRIFDKYYYYVGGIPEEKGMIYSPSDNQEVTYSFITGIEDFARINSGILYLEIRADAVQINRMEAFWGISQLP